jgi:hypothetical protein
MKTYFGFMCLILLAGACKNEKIVTVTDTSSPVANILLPDILEVDYTVNIDTTSSDTWQTSFVSKEFLAALRKDVHSGKIPVYSPFYSDTSGALITVPYLEMELGKLSGHKSFNWGKYFTYQLGFTEEWHFDTAAIKFTKAVKWWFPLFYSNSDSIHHRLFRVCGGPADELLAENIIYEIRFNEHAQGFRRLDTDRFYTWLTSMAVNNKIQVFPPDNHSNVLSTETIKQRLGEGEIKVNRLDESGNEITETVLQKFDVSELHGIIFIEDWFYNSNTGFLSKSVTGFAPVRYYEDENGNALKSIPFVCYTGQKKATIL